MAIFKKAAFAALFLSSAISSAALLTSVEAQAMGGCSAERSAKNLCGNHPDKGGARIVKIKVTPEEPPKDGVTRPPNIWTKLTSVKACLWENYQELRKNSKYKYEGTHALWEPQIAQKDLVERCPNTSWAQTGIDVSKLLKVRAKLELASSEPKPKLPPKLPPPIKPPVLPPV